MAMAMASKRMREGELAAHFFLLHPRKWQTRAPVLTGGPGAAPGGVASKNGWVYMRVQRGAISYSRESLSVVTK